METGEVRSPKSGEHYHNDGLYSWPVSLADHNYKEVHKFKIMVRIELPDVIADGFLTADLLKERKVTT